MALEKNITWKRGKRKQYHLLIILRLLGRISSGEEDENFWGKSSKFKKNGGGAEY